MKTPKEIIEEIRREEFGIGEELDDKAKKLNKKTHARLDRALKKLSEDLYSKEIHFVLELIQNADDNQYDNQEPFLRFIIDNEKILVQNNEIGFNEENVRALCDVGNSTKSKKMGYIGEKGIGFKSVFRITDTPQIFSNGFQFEFRREDKDFPLSYIVPYWIENVPEYIDPRFTNIVLPLRKDVSTEFFSKFDEIEPVLILFLRKLKRIEVINNISNKHDIITLQENNGIRKIHHNDNIKFYKVIREFLNVPEEVREDNRKDVEQTELILAFPLDNHGNAKTDEEQKVFVFLPTRSYRFKFMIQGDFLVPANREDIHKDKKWNTWLRDSIPDLFIKAIEEFKKDEKLSRTYYNYLPTKKEITDPFFSELVDEIYEKLKQYDCILSESNQWRKPQDLYIGDKEIQNIITNSTLKKFFNKEYISDRISIRSEILNYLEIHKFDIDKLIELLGNPDYTDWIKNQPDEWFVKLYVYLGSKKLNEEQFKKIKELKIIRLENHQLTSIQEGSIFLPLDKKTNYGFEEELRIIKRETIQPKEDEKEQKNAIYHFLKELGIKNATPFDIIENHILPIYKNGLFKNKSKEKLLGYIKYIKDHIQEYQEKRQKGGSDPLAELKNHLCLRAYQLIDGKEDYKKPNEIYLSKIYGNSNNLEELFEGIENIFFIHREYIDDIINKYRRLKRKGNKKDIEKKRAEEIQEWFDFFKELGVKEIPKVISDYYNDKIFKCNDIVKIINLHKNNPKKIESLIHLLDEYWNYYSKYKNSDHGSYYRRVWYSEYKESDYYEALLTNPIFPANDGNLYKSSQVYLDKPEIKKLLDDFVPYLSIKIKNDQLISDLKINTEANIEIVLEYLKHLVKTQNKDIKTFEKLYKFLYEKFNNNPEKIKNDFSNFSIIYVPNTEKSYFKKEEVLWKDVQSIFGNHKAYLEKHYPELKNFFVNLLEVNEKPKPKDYADVLVAMSNQPLNEKEEKILWIIYKELNRYLNPNSSENLISKETWWNDFINKKIFWSDKNEWKNSNQIYINDNQELFELFKDTIHVLKLKEDDYPRLSYLIKEANIPYLSETVEMELVNDEEGDFEEELTEKIKSFIPYIIRYFYYTVPEKYEILKKEGVIKELINIIINIKCYSYNKLDVKFILGNYEAYKEKEILLFNGNLHILKEQINNDDTIAIELGKRLGKRFEDYYDKSNFITLITLIFVRKIPHRIEEYLTKINIRELPTEEIRELEIIQRNYSMEKKIIIEVAEEENTYQESDPQILDKDRIEPQIYNKEQPKSHQEDKTSQSTKKVVEKDYQDRRIEKSKSEMEIHQKEEKQQDKNQNTKETAKKTEWQPSVSASEVDPAIEEYSFEEKYEIDGDKKQSSFERTSEIQKIDLNSETIKQNSKEESAKNAEWQPSVVAREVDIKIEEYSFEEQYKEIDHENIKSTSRINENQKVELSPKEIKDIGRWGEELVYEFLKKEYSKKYSDAELRETDEEVVIYSNGQTLVKIIWANKNKDTGIGYDFIIETNQNKQYIEVKSSKEDTKEWFEVSQKQWEFIEQHKENYTIYRVCNAGTKDAKILRINNPYQLWMEGKLKVNPIRIKI